ncbi:endomembrane protein (macronuclear) [Tetrahymena thermophila SB210]|uniref:Transmembrane 9 superfamily member n=1 Tax=Tetrahymena thermophila (strain SB210) TaxID=312017 RepID=I7MD82_TETTS|nr:endomembrane protein [Tetrahymena thermophila SB210]EAR85665.2 endomembrane protein [Tetrahymena thermophila SB210]|eukprot:XP_001033328.2 endomembrane protein [Tetrahymena thermophila SB210]
MTDYKFSILIKVLVFILFQTRAVLAILKTDVSSSRKIFQEEQRLQLEFNELLSSQSQFPVNPQIIPFCQVENDSDKLSAHLLYRFFQLSSFNAQLKVKKNYQFECTKEYTDEEIILLKRLIDQDYKMNINLDDFPIFEDGNKIGLQLGKKEGDKYYINNYIYMLINTYEIKPKEHIIDSFFGHPISYNIESALWEQQDFDTVIMKNEKKQEIKGNRLTFIYQVHVNVINNENDRIKREKVFQILNLYIKQDIDSFVFLWIPLTVTSILLVYKISKLANEKQKKTQKHSIKYQQLDSFEQKSQQKDEEIDENLTSWQSLETEVFRPPSKQGLLACFIGFGFLQFLNLLSLVALELVNSFILQQYGQGLFKNSDDILMKYLYSSSFSSMIYGYASSLYYSRFQGQSKFQIFSCLIIYYLLFLLILFFLEEKNHLKLIDLGLAYQQNVDSDCHSIIVGFFMLIPLPILIGYLAGFVRSKTELKLRFNLPSFLNLPSSNHKTFIFKRSILSGFLNFLIVIYPINKIAHSIIAFNILAVNKLALIAQFLLIILQISLITVFLTYQDLNRGYYKWQWKSFWMGGSIGFYIYFYLIGYLYFAENQSFQDILYLNQYLIPICLTTILICGSCSIQLSYNFVNHLYYKFLNQYKKQGNQ